MWFSPQPHRKLAHLPFQNHSRRRFLTSLFPKGFRNRSFNPPSPPASLNNSNHHHRSRSGDGNNYLVPGATVATLHAHLKDGGGGCVERALSAVRARLDPSCVNEVLGRCSDDDSVMGMRFFIWAGVQSGYRHSSYGYSKACDLLRVRKNPGVILDAIERCRIDGWPISVKTIKIVLNLCKEAGLSDEALGVLRRMRELDLRPDTNVYNTVVRLFCTKGDVGTAEDLMQEMGDLGLYPDMITVVEMIKGLCGAGRSEDAYGLLKLIKGYGCSPNVVVYSAVLEGFCRAGDAGRVLELLGEMEKEGGDCRPNVVSYTSLIRCYCEKDSMMEALGVLDRMMAHGCAPNRVTISTLLDGLCKEGQVGNARELIDKVVAWGAVPEADCCSSLVVSLIRCKFIDDAKRQFEAMLGCGLEPDGLASSLVIRSLCGDGKVLEGFRLVDEIERMGFSPSIDSDIYSILLEGLFRRGNVDEAANLARMMVDKGIVLKPPFANRVVEQLKKFDCGDLVSLLSKSKRKEEGKIAIGLSTGKASGLCILSLLRCKSFASICGRKSTD